MKKRKNKKKEVTKSPIAELYLMNKNRQRKFSARSHGFKNKATIFQTGTIYICGALVQGWQRNLVPKKFRGIDSEQLPLFRVLIPRHSEVYGRVYSEARNGRKWHEKN
jgi:hypothetical protein